MNRKLTVHYVVPETITSPAVHSQAIGTAITLYTRLQMPVIFYGLAKWDDPVLSRQSESVISLLTQEEIQVNIYNNRRQRGVFAILSLFRQMLTRVRYSLKSRPGPVLARNLFGATVAYLATRGIRGAGYVVDLRGHSGAELEMAGWMRGDGLKARLFYRWERFLLENARAVLCVSQPLAQYVRSSTRRTPLCYVIPSCLDQVLAEQLEHRLNQPYDSTARSEGPVLAYAGTVTNWNVLPPMLSLFMRVRATFPRARFLCLTPHKAKAEEAFQSFGISSDCYSIEHVPHEDMLSTLEIADVGLLLREPSPVNRVASPIKAAEYLAAGLPLIATDGIGDLSGLICDARVGLLLPSLDEGSWDDGEIGRFFDDLLAHRSEYRQRAMRLAMKHYVRSSYVDVYRKALLGDGE